MTSYKEALVLLTDLKEFAGEHEIPGAEKLVSKARQAIEKDLGGKYSSVREQLKSNQVDLIQ